MSVIFVCLYINDVNAITQISRDRQVLLTCMKGAKPVVLDSQAALGHDADRGTHYIFREYEPDLDLTCARYRVCFYVTQVGILVCLRVTGLAQCNIHRPEGLVVGEREGSGDGSLICHNSLNNAVVSYCSYLTYFLTLRFALFTLYLYQ